MKLSDEIRIEAPPAQVYAALNDPEILRRAIPGCQSLTRTSDTELEATVTAKVGPVKATFKGAVRLSDLDPPNGYTISGEGKGGAAGFARGSARVRLAADGGATVLRYEVDADVGGKLAQLGGRLIEGTSKKLAGEFFEAFKAAVAAPAVAPVLAPAPAAVPPSPPAAAPEAAPAAKPALGLPTWAWAGLVAFVVAFAVFLIVF